MSVQIKPWARKAFELIYHAETHWVIKDDYDKRLALTSFDNAIEVSIALYLNLNPTHRGGRSYPKADVDKWIRNYHTKLDFFFYEIAQRGLPIRFEQSAIIWLHDQRNEIYHGSSSGIPEETTIIDIRLVALWVFSVLFEYPDIEAILGDSIANSDKYEHRPKNQFYDEGQEKAKQQNLNPEQLNSLTVATLAGKWDEDNQNDMEIIKRLSDGF
ncbi:MAG: hypothetical protein ACMZ63_06400 [Methylotenera sp.]